MDNQIDTTTGTVKLRAMYDNTNTELFPNQFVNIKLLVNTLHNQLVVPASAIQRGASGAFVFLVNPDHTVSMRTVMLGQTADDKVAVASGLMAGDTVVVDGADRLRNGAKVVLPGEQPPIAAPRRTWRRQCGGRSARRTARRPGQRRCCQCRRGRGCAWWRRSARWRPGRWRRRMIDAARHLR